ncbi:MAG: hypothetical protein ACT4P1_15710 [Sporichthyaceae bacterium]
MPGQPAAVLLYDAAGDARCLAADFDVKAGGRARVDADADAFSALIEACGGRTIADISPTGGRHVYVLWARPIPITELRPVLHALRTLHPSLDIAPMLNPTAGCIRPPGARHRTGGHQTLTTALTGALAAVHAPCGPAVWSALLDRLTPQLTAHHSPTGATDPLDDTDEMAEAPAAMNGRLSPRIERIAATGTYDTDRYASPSEARQAVITAAAAAGWTLTDVAARVERGTWPGLAALYARYRPQARRQALAADWRKAHAHLDQRKNARNSTTRASTHTGGNSPPHDPSLRPALRPNSRGETEDAADYGWIRAWWNAVIAIESTSRWADRGGLSKRLVLRALGAMAQRRASRHLDIGRRGLALACGLDDSTVSEILRALRDEDDPVIELLESNRGEQGDLYTLRIPDAALEAAAWRRWRAGNITAIHPVFRELGAARALVHEHLTSEPAQRRDLIRAACLPPRTVDDALRTLAEHGLAEHTPTGWQQGPANLDHLADTLGITEIVTDLINEYGTERAAWRALLGAHANLGSSPANDPYVPMHWPPALHPPPPAGPADQAYDDALASTGAAPELEASELAIELTALELLTRAFGATVVDQPDASDPRFGVFGRSPTPTTVTETA